MGDLTVELVQYPREIPWPSDFGGKVRFLILRTLFQHQEGLAPRIYDAAVGGEEPHTESNASLVIERFQIQGT
jgi:hypothetical protein